MKRICLYHHAVLGLAIAIGTPAAADVFVERGPTPLLNGDAVDEDDITIRNDHLVISVAVGSQPPWGVAPGGIIDASPTRGEGRAPVDVLSLFDLIPNNWSEWPTTYQEFEIVSDGPEKGVVRVQRDWGDVDMVTTYTLEAGSDSVHIFTEMTNNGDEALEDLLSGYTLWSDGGTVHSVPGIADVSSGSAEDAFADWMAIYSETWSLGMHAPYFDTVDYYSQDMYLAHDLHPGETQEFEGWLQIRPDGNISPIAVAAAERRGESTGVVRGSVATREGDKVESPWVVVNKDGAPYFWAGGADGTFEFEAPAGDFTTYATATGHARSTEQELSVTPGSEATQTYNDLRRPARVRFEVRDADTDEPLDARIEVVEGEMPDIGFLGETTFFTELEPIGVVEAQIAPGDYVFEVGHAKGFLTAPAEARASVDSGEIGDVEAPVKVLFRPSQQNWYMSDMHHHSDILDGFTPPQWVVRSQLAEGLDLVHLSDHDSIDNLVATGEFSDQRGVPFIPGLEFSPSWAHFVVGPIDWGKDIEINVGQSTAHELFTEARRMGADMISAAHPRRTDGYFSSIDRGAVPGGFTAEYDLVEHNWTYSEEVIKDTYALWDQGWDYYVVAGTDVHDVWAYRSGRMRTVAYVPGELTVDKYVKALLDGNSYTTRGPLVYPETMFGSTVNVTAGDSVELNFTVSAVDGLQLIELIGEGGEVVDRREISDAPSTQEVTFEPTPDENTWYALRVESVDENQAYTNPIWINVVDGIPR